MEAAVKVLPMKEMIGVRIRRILEERGIKQVDFAEKLGCSQAQLNQWISSARKDMQISSAIRIADALGITLDQLVGREKFRPGDQYEEPALHHQIDLLIRRGAITAETIWKLIQTVVEEKEEGHRGVTLMAAEPRKKKYIRIRGREGGS